MTQDAMEYRMKVHLFGAVSSPSCANYALRRIVQGCQAQFDSCVLNTILQNFYMNDCLTSLPTENEAFHMAQNLIAACAKGGFQLSKWMSNSRFMSRIPEEYRSKSIKELDLDKDDLPMERVLGLHWCTEENKFTFRLSIKEHPYTRRGILSMVSSIYDPLGFLSPFTLPVKQLLQKMCKGNFGWDEKIPQVFFE